MGPNVCMKPAKETSADESVESVKQIMAVNRQNAQAIDNWCRVAFPMVFTIFNLIYWPFYIYSPNGFIEG